MVGCVTLSVEKIELGDNPWNGDIFQLVKAIPTETKSAFEIEPGLSYEGGWRGSSRHGEGRLMWENGDSCSGVFINDDLIVVQKRPEHVIALEDDELKEFTSGESIPVIGYSEQKTYSLCVLSDCHRWIPSRKLLPSSKLKDWLKQVERIQKKDLPR
eukprot:TRINITY_DN4894_c0_g1_i7.p1 TRINITY_DN4894_c0_g1~~TRINITY_DN4894_c0_g1_i7.p1  ORF type:complete len:157 (-),score=29.37 TRINITY_DN4894_c0_g1_i7:43-513(-)